MLDRIVMDLLDMSFKIRFVANRMFPEAPLPERAFSPPLPSSHCSLSGDLTREQAFSSPPAPGKISTVLWQSRNAMIGKNNDCIDLERPLDTRRAKRMTKRRYLLRQQ
jgi:hypothetical protein